MFEEQSFKMSGIDEDGDCRICIEVGDKSLHTHVNVESLENLKEFIEEQLEGYEERHEACSACNETGSSATGRVDSNCSTCGGSGVIKRSDDADFDTDMDFDQ